MDALEVLFAWVIFGIFLYTFPPLVFISLILLKIFKNSVIFLDEKDALRSFLVAIPCAFFTFEIFYSAMYSLSVKRYFALKFELYRFFDIGVLTHWETFWKLSLIFLLLLFIYNLIFAIKYNTTKGLKILSAICRTQISILFAVSVVTILGMIYYYWGNLEIWGGLWLSYWIIGVVFTVLVMRAAVKRKGAALAS